MSFDYDLFVIGGGSGGVRAARMAAGTGARVALAEEYRMGGTCVIRGCVPKKLMVYASSFSQTFDDAVGFGWDVAPASFDWSRLIAAKDVELARLEALYRAGLSGADVTIYDARAVLADPHSVKLSSGETITAAHILVATGGRPFVPAVPGAEHAITSNEVFDLPEMPKRVLVVGGGYIACEFAGIFNGLGVKTHQFYRGAQILRGFDGEVRGHVADAMIARGIDLHLGTDVVKIEKHADGLHVSCTNGNVCVVDQVLFATGRVANTEGLGLEALGLSLGKTGEIPVNTYSQTAVPSVYALGDVTNRVNLTPVAIREAMAFVDTVFRGTPTPVDHALIPTAVFTQPEIGTVGMAEDVAAQTCDIQVFRAAFRPMVNILAGRDERMLMKLIVAKKTQKVLGCHIVGPSAAEMIQMAGIAIKMGATKADFDRTCAVHPTAAEELVTMRNPIEVAQVA